MPSVAAHAPDPEDGMYANIAALRRSTHTHVIGGSRSGKSKFIEWLIRNDLAENQPFCVIDWHGTLYRDLLEYLSHVRPRRDFVILNPAMPERITGCRRPRRNVEIWTDGRRPPAAAFTRILAASSG